MTKDEAAKALGVSTRAINRYVERGRLHVTIIENRGDGRKEAQYDPAQVAELKAQMEQEREQEKSPSPMTHDNLTALQHNYGGRLSRKKSEPVHTPAEVAAPRVEERVKLHRKLCLTRSEAAEYSGLGIGNIKRAIASGLLNSLEEGANGTIIIRRADLEEYVTELFERGGQSSTD